MSAADPRPDTDRKVIRRTVFYLPGYDPFPPRRYRELYRREAQVQAAISGYRIGVARAAEGQGWTVNAEIEGTRVQTRFEVLTWSDLVQASMRQGIAATYVQLARTAWIYTSSGALLRLARLRVGPMIAALYPFGILLSELALAAVCGWLAGRLLALWLGPAGWVAGGLTVWLLLDLMRRVDRWTYAWYLIHDYAYGAQCRGAYPLRLAERIVAWRTRIEAAVSSGVDEILLVGHSTGAHLAVSVLAPMPVPASGAVVALLTLGQVVPMIAFLPEAGRLRSDLRMLASRAEITWVDVTAPGDGCSFALCDPVAVTGVAPADQRWPLVISAAFSQTLAPERWRRLRRRWFRLHFQYLCAFDRPGAYDYFRITAGPRTLGDRFATVAPSPGRLQGTASPDPASGT